jgi:hypothetical protein
MCLAKTCSELRGPNIYNTLDFACRQAETTRLYRAVIRNINGVDIYPTEAEALTKAPFLLLKGEVQAEKKMAATL